MKGFGIRVAIALLASWLAGSVAAAEEPAYEQLIAEAVDEYSRGNFQESRRLFELAHRKRPNARTLRGLGIVEYELREYARAVGHLELALEDTRNPLSETQRREAQQLIDRAWRFLGRYRLRVGPEITALVVDGRPRAARDGVELRLEPGSHRIVAEGDGRPPLVLDLEVRGGEREELVLRLPSAASPESAPAATPATPGPATPSRTPPGSTQVSRTGPPAAALVAFTAAGLGMLTFGVAGGLALDEHKRLESDCAPSCSDSRVEAFDAYVLTADIGLAVGVVGAALGAWLWLADDGEQPPIAIQTAPGLVGLQARGRF